MKHHIFWAGDSTVKTNKITTYPQTGIGQVMNLYLKNEYEIYNYAENGRSTKSFINEGRLQRIVWDIQQEDYLFIQFGHNDQKIDDPNRYTDIPTYQNYLKQFVEAAMEKKAYPVLITPLYRRYFHDNGLIHNDVHGDYPIACEKVAIQMGVPLIDLCEKSKQLLKQTGVINSKKWFMHIPASIYEAYPDGLNDNTHMRYEGAVVMAGLIAEGLRELGGRYKDMLIEELL